MYVHIGNDIVIKDKDIIAILDIKSLEKKKNLKNICQVLKLSDNIIEVSKETKKTWIIVQKEEGLKGYISNISSSTLGKRASKYERMDN